MSTKNSVALSVLTAKLSLKTVLSSIGIAVMVAMTLAPTTSMAMGQSLPNTVKEETIQNGQVYQSFNLRSQDGSVITLLAETARKQGSLSAIPSEKGASHRSCGTGDTNMTLALIDVMMRTMNGQLSTADRNYLQKVPRCEPYLSTLVTINSFLVGHVSPDPATAGDRLQRVSVVKASDNNYYLTISTAANKLAMFKITQSLRGVSNLRDLANISIAPETSGEGHGIVFQLADISNSSPTHYSRTESCEVTDTVYRPCDGRRDGGRDGHRNDRDCGTSYISHPGHRQVDSTSSSTTYSLTMSITNSQNQAMFQGTLRDVRDDNSDSNGICTRD